MIQPNIHTNAIINEPYSNLSLRVAELVRDQLKRKPASRFGLPTGRTPTEMYKLLASWSKDSLMDWRLAKCFGLDEYLQVDENASYRKFLEQNLYRYTNLSQESRFNPAFVDNYDAAIQACGGLDMTILGIGHNGHIAFNEPGTPLESWTHSIWLDESTRLANAEFFKDSDAIPKNAVTMGVQTILASENIVLMVSGKKKQGILTKALKGPITSDVPASYLQTHRNVTVITDFDY